jgi:hypothetical protein
MRIGDEYRLQTKEGSEWDREFRNRQTKLANDDPDLFIRRDTLLYADADRIVRKQKIVQGASKESRQFAIFRDQNAPQTITDNIPSGFAISGRAARRTSSKRRDLPEAIARSFTFLFQSRLMMICVD